MANAFKLLKGRRAFQLCLFALFLVILAVFYNKARLLVTLEGDDSDGFSVETTYSRGENVKLVREVIPGMLQVF